MVHERKNILLIVPHLPAFDSCIPLIICPHKRGNVGASENFTKFIEDDSPQSQHVTVRKTYGNLSYNLDKAPMIVEQQMNKKNFKL